MFLFWELIMAGMFAYKICLTMTIFVFATVLICPMIQTLKTENRSFAVLQIDILVSSQQMFCTKSIDNFILIWAICSNIITFPTKWRRFFEFFHQLGVMNICTLFYCLIDLLFYLVVLWSLFLELNFFASVLLLLFLGIQSAHSIVLYLLIRLHLIFQPSY